eukprot:3764069-Rhodomonas_salina.1
MAVLGCQREWRVERTCPGEVASALSQGLMAKRLCQTPCQFRTWPRAVYDRMTTATRDDSTGPVPGVARPRGTGVGTCGVESRLR